MIIRIEPKDWYQDFFYSTLLESDILRLPVDSYDDLPEVKKEQLRQTQIFQDEVIQVLGTHDKFHLIMKFDKTIGWVESHKIKVAKNITNFKIPESNLVTADQFFKEWKGVLYLFGGISKTGIDCSGFTQAFFLEVYGKVIPKNSRDQRKINQSKNFQDIQNFNLVFCHRKGSDMHHVAIFFDNELWHARPKHGVVSQTVEEFLELFEVEYVMSIL